MKRIAGGLLLQGWDYSDENIMTMKAATKRQATKDELEALAFSWKVCKHVKSNASCLCIQGQDSRHRHRTD